MAFSNPDTLGMLLLILGLALVTIISVRLWPAHPRAPYDVLAYANASLHSTPVVVWLADPSWRKIAGRSGTLWLADDVVIGEEKLQPWRLVTPDLQIMFWDAADVPVADARQDGEKKALSILQIPGDLNPPVGVTFDGDQMTTLNVDNKDVPFKQEDSIRLLMADMVHHVRELIAREKTRVQA